MSDENVKYNEIRCNKLVLGNEETGVIELAVRNDGESTELVISQADAKGSVCINCTDGKLALYLTNNEDGKSNGIIALDFNDEGFPRLGLGGKVVEDEIDNSILLGLDKNASPRLYFSDDRDGKESHIVLGASDDGNLYLTLVNRRANGGIVFLNTNDTSAGIVTASRNQLDDEDRELTERWGVFIASGPDRSVLNVEGKEIVSMPRQNKKADPEV